MHIIILSFPYTIRIRPLFENLKTIIVFNLRSCHRIVLDHTFNAIKSFESISNECAMYTLSIL